MCIRKDIFTDHIPLFILSIIAKAKTNKSSTAAKGSNKKRSRGTKGAAGTKPKKYAIFYICAVYCI